MCNNNDCSCVWLILIIISALCIWLGSGLKVTGIFFNDSVS